MALISLYAGKSRLTWRSTEGRYGMDSKRSPIPLFWIYTCGEGRTDWPDQVHSHVWLVVPVAWNWTTALDRWKDRSVCRQKNDPYDIVQSKFVKTLAWGRNNRGFMEFDLPFRGKCIWPWARWKRCYRVSISGGASPFCTGSRRDPHGQQGFHDVSRLSGLNGSSAHSGAGGGRWEATAIRWTLISPEWSQLLVDWQRRLQIAPESSVWYFMLIKGSQPTLSPVYRGLHGLFYYSEKENRKLENYKKADADTTLCLAFFEHGHLLYTRLPASLNMSCGLTHIWCQWGRGVHLKMSLPSSTQCIF